MATNITSTLAAGEQSGDREPKIAGDLVTELMNAHQARQSGDPLAQKTALMRAEQAARKDALNSERLRVEDAIKNQEKVYDLLKQLHEAGQSNFILKAYLGAAKDGNWKLLDMLAPAIKDINPDIYKHGMSLRAAAKSKYPETMLGGILGVGDSSQEKILATEQEDEINARTNIERIRRKQELGQELTAEERAVLMNQGLQENPFKQGQQGEDPTEAFRRDTTPKQDDTSTTNQKDAQYLIDNWEQLGYPSKEAAEKAARELFGGASRQTDFSRVEGILDIYKDDFDNSYLLNKLNNMMSGDSRKAFVSSMHRFLKGRTYAEMEQFPREKEAAAKIAIGEIIENAQGGEIAKRNLLAREILSVHLPEIQKRLDKMEAEGVDLGPLVELMEKGARAVGATIDPAIASIFADIQFLTTEFVALRSGSAVSDRERALYEQIFTRIGAGYKLNRATIDGLMTIVMRGMRNTFHENMGKNWGEYATNLKFDLGEVAPQEYIKYITQAQFDAELAKVQAQKPEITAEQLLEGYRKRRILVR